MGDLNGLLGDPDFQKLDIASKRATLSKVDPDFAKLSDEDFGGFLEKATPAATPPSQLQQFAQHAIEGFGGAIAAPVEALLSPQETAKALWAQAQHSAGRAADEFKQGHYSDAAANAVTAIPGVGPMLTQGANELQQGSYGAAGGDAAGFVGGATTLEQIPRLGKAILSNPTVAQGAGMIGAGMLGKAVGVPWWAASWAGRKLGPEIAEWVGGKTTVGEPTPIVSEAEARPILDQIARTPSYGGRAFDKLDEGEKATIRKIADAYEGQSKQAQVAGNSVASASSRWPDQSKLRPLPGEPGYDPDWGYSPEERAARVAKQQQAVQPQAAQPVQSGPTSNTTDVQEIIRNLQERGGATAPTGAAPTTTRPDVVQVNPQAALPPSSENLSIQRAAQNWQDVMQSQRAPQVNPQAQSVMPPQVPTPGPTGNTINIQDILQNLRDNPIPKWHAPAPAAETKILPASSASTLTPEQLAAAQALADEMAKAQVKATAPEEVVAPKIRRRTKR